MTPAIEFAVADVRHNVRSWLKYNAKALGAIEGMKVNTELRNMVVLVDDEPNIRETVAFILEAEGIEVETGADGVEGLEAVKRCKPKVVLLDGGSHLLRVSPAGVKWENGYSGESDVSVKLSVDDFLAIADGNFDGRLAVASERIEVEGNMELAEGLIGFVEPEEKL